MTIPNPPKMINFLVAIVIFCIVVNASALDPDIGDEENKTHSGITEKAPQRKPSLFANFLEQHTDICACVNVPLREKFPYHLPINNKHGKDLLAYYEPNCLQKKLKPIYIAIREHPNNFWDTDELEELSILEAQNQLTIRSLGPNTNSEMFKTSCINNSNVVVMELEVLETDNNFQMPIPCKNEVKVSVPKYIHFFAMPDFQGTNPHG